MASDSDGLKTEFLGVGLRRRNGTCVSCQNVALVNQCMSRGEGVYIVKDKAEWVMPKPMERGVDEGVWMWMKTGEMQMEVDVAR
jgi:hypothetical protein